MEKDIELKTALYDRVKGENNHLLEKLQVKFLQEKEKFFSIIIV